MLWGAHTLFHISFLDSKIKISTIGMCPCTCVCMCMCVCRYIYAMACTSCISRGQTQVLSLQHACSRAQTQVLRATCVFQGSNSGSQAWQGVPSAIGQCSPAPFCNSKGLREKRPLTNQSPISDEVVFLNSKSDLLFTKTSTVHI